ncbi:LacI family DNA-binding transcriptional regulator [Jiella sonneratiae]|uniref:LacI family DNA-binding transcriptional regulator n=1 Tax=Jiella sonneratiae TaxID=2816856 RepID=A0ABS3J3I5_9HYPH|nr:LacI family DNA-binding transcriptional regulator [Jiella sonneratiae]MBO0904234.1 LacI family DNA-binding transcriptional regulator [Jiella sonneratiae]
MPAKDKSIRPARRSSVTSSAATVRDVANLAQVSTATVSRTLNAPDLVRPEVRERVSNAIQKLGYIPNDSARALRQNQTRFIGVVVPTLSYALYADFYAAVEEQLSALGYFPVLSTTDYDLDVEAEQITRLSRQGAQGLILVGRVRSSRAASYLAATGLPFVSTYATDPLGRDGTIGFDNEAAINEVVNHLASLGHRRIAMLSGLRSNLNDRAIGRANGFISAVRKHGIASPDWIFEGPYTIESGRRALCALLDRGIDATAIVCGSDMLAIGGLQECKARGIRVPRDLSIVGFDDLEIAAHIDPPLTTVAVPSREQGRLAAQAIVDLCNGRQCPPNAVLPTHMVVRETTAGPGG